MTEVATVGMDAATALSFEESRISRGLGTGVLAMIEVGDALRNIRDQKLYQESGFRTFDSYCLRHWEMRRERVDRTIRSVEVANILMGADKKLPRSEYALRMLAPYTKNPEELLGYWAKAEIAAGDGPVTGNLLEQVISDDVDVVDATPVPDPTPAIPFVVAVAPVEPVEPHFVPHSEVSLDSLSGELELSDEVLQYVLEPQPRFRVYRIYDAANKIIYIGYTGRGLQRTLEHSRNSPWFPRAHHCKWESYMDPQAAKIREADLIDKFSPPFNTQYNSDWRAARSAYES